MAQIDALKEIAQEIGEISGIRSAPHKPPEKVNQYPFATIYAADGEYEASPPDVMKGLHNPQVEVHVQRRELPRDYDRIMRLADEIPKKLLTTLKDNGFSELETWESIAYELAPSSWQGIDTLVIRYTINNLKVTTNL